MAEGEADRRRPQRHAGTARSRRPRARARWCPGSRRAGGPGCPARGRQGRPPSAWCSPAPARPRSAAPRGTGSSARARPPCTAARAPRPARAGHQGGGRGGHVPGQLAVADVAAVLGRRTGRRTGRPADPPADPPAAVRAVRRGCSAAIRSTSQAAALKRSPTTAGIATVAGCWCAALVNTWSTPGQHLAPFRPASCRGSCGDGP
jgi:hypothetical protein